MSVVYDSLGGENPPPDLDDARLRLAWQQHLLDAALVPLAEEAAVAVETQEQYLRDVYKPLLNGEKREIAEQELQLSLIRQSLIGDIGGRISHQSGLIAGASVAGAAGPVGTGGGDAPAPAPGGGRPPFAGDVSLPSAGGFVCDPAPFPVGTIRYQCVYYSLPGVTGEYAVVQTLTAGTGPNGCFAWYSDLTLPPGVVPDRYGPLHEARAGAEAECSGGGPGGVGDGDTDDTSDDDTTGDDTTDDTDDDDDATPLCTPVRICEPVEVRILKEEVEEAEDGDAEEGEEEEDDTKGEGDHKVKDIGDVTIPRALPPPLFDPGTPTICVVVTQYLPTFYRIGAGFASTFGSTVQDAGLKRQAFLKGLEGIPGFGDSLRSIFDASTPNVEKMADQVIQNARAVFKGDENAIQIGLHLAKSFFSLLESVQLGINAGLWLTATLRVELRKLQQIIDYLIEYVSPITPPGVGEIASMVLSDEMSPTHAACVTRLSGSSEAVLERLVMSRRARPSEADVVRDGFRFAQPRAAVESRLRKLGWILPDERDLLLRNADFFPPPSDLIRFAIRDFWDPNKLGRREMERELADNKELVDVFAASGIRKIAYVDGRGNRRDFDVPLAYWMSSYEEVSPTQVFEMLHRLRPGRTHKFALPGPGNVMVPPPSVDISDVRKLLKEKDYNPVWRDRLAAISYRLPTRVDVRRIYRSGGYGPVAGAGGFDLRDPSNPRATAPAERELVEVNRDAGYAESDAQRLAYWTARDVAESATKAQNARHKSLLCRAFQSGAIDRESLLTQLTPLVHDRDERIRFAALCDVERQLKRVETAVKTIRSMFLRVVIDAAGAVALLARAGVKQERIRDYMDLWQLELAGRRKEVAAGQLCAWRESGIISDQEYLIRLVRLGYSRIDATNMLRHCHIGLAARSAKEVNRRLLAQQRLQEKAAKLAEAAARAGEKQREQVVKRALSARTDANLRKWLSLGTIDDDDVLATLRLKGWTNDDARRWLHAYYSEGQAGDDGG